MGEAITGDGGGMEEKKEGNQRPPHLRCPPTFQPWLEWWPTPATPTAISIQHRSGVLRHVGHILKPVHQAAALMQPVYVLAMLCAWADTDV